MKKSQIVLTCVAFLAVAVGVALGQETKAPDLPNPTVRKHLEATIQDPKSKIYMDGKWMPFGHMGHPQDLDANGDATVTVDDSGGSGSKGTCKVVNGFIVYAVITSVSRNLIYEANATNYTDPISHQPFNQLNTITITSGDGSGTTLTCTIVSDVK